MTRLRIVVAYDGRPFAGWQSQPGGNTVQDRIEAAIRIVTGGDVRVHGSGRTDAGVHALAQVAHFDAPDRPKLAPDAWQRAINYRLPETIRILHCASAPPGFHARFDATGKTYRYRIRNEPVLPPLEAGRAWHLPKPLDAGALAAACRLVEGTHDFAGFAALRGDGSDPRDTVRTIRSVRIDRDGPDISLTFHGTGFLYKMVRLLTGSLVRVASGKADPGWIDSLLRRDPPVTSSFAAPAHGLYLAGVDYPDSHATA